VRVDRQHVREGVITLRSEKRRKGKKADGRRHVRYQGQTGSEILTLSFSAFDPGRVKTSGRASGVEIHSMNCLRLRFDPIQGVARAQTEAMGQDCDGRSYPSVHRRVAPISPYWLLNRFCGMLAFEKM
jgi:hypothetical protein